MILKVNDNDYANVSMQLDINCELKYINVIVKATNKVTHKVTMKTFYANEFDHALTYYAKCEEFLCGGWA